MTPSNKYILKQTAKIALITSSLTVSGVFGTYMAIKHYGAVPVFVPGKWISLFSWFEPIAATVALTMGLGVPLAFFLWAHGMEKRGERWRR